MRFVFLILLAVGSISASTANAHAQERTKAEVPPDAMKQVVRRILTWSFKPARKPRVINIAHQFIEPSWLPMIKNIEFRLVPESELKKGEPYLYFFTAPTVAKGVYHAGFALGTFTCNYTGDSWSFRVVGQKVRLWKVGLVFGFCNVD